MFSCFCVKKIKNIRDPFWLSHASIKTNQYANRLLHLHDNQPPLNTWTQDLRKSTRLWSQIEILAKMRNYCLQCERSDSKMDKMLNFDVRIWCPVTLVKSTSTEYLNILLPVQDSRALNRKLAGPTILRVRKSFVPCFMQQWGTFLQVNGTLSQILDLVWTISTPKPKMCQHFRCRQHSHLTMQG